jgi:hypothetical protein
MEDLCDNSIWIWIKTGLFSFFYIFTDSIFNAKWPDIVAAWVIWFNIVSDVIGLIWYIKYGSDWKDSSLEAYLYSFNAYCANNDQRAKTNRTELILKKWVNISKHRKNLISWTIIYFLKIYAVNND